MSATLTALHDCVERFERLREHVRTTEERLYQMSTEVRRKLDSTRWPGDDHALASVRAHLEHASHALMYLRVHLDIMARHEEHQQMEVMP